jgi:hypothetical protein
MRTIESTRTNMIIETYYCQRYKTVISRRVPAVVLSLYFTYVAARVKEGRHHGQGCHDQERGGKEGECR